MMRSSPIAKPGAVWLVARLGCAKQCAPLVPKRNAVSAPFLSPRTGFPQARQRGTETAKSLALTLVGGRRYVGEMAHAEVYEDSNGKFRWRVVDWVAPEGWDVPLESTESFDTVEAAVENCGPLPLTIVVPSDKPTLSFAEKMAQARANNRRRRPSA